MKSKQILNRSFFYQTLNCRTDFFVKTALKLRGRRALCTSVARMPPIIYIFKIRELGEDLTSQWVQIQTLAESRCIYRILKDLATFENTTLQVRLAQTCYFFWAPYEQYAYSDIFTW